LLHARTSSYVRRVLRFTAAERGTEVVVALEGDIVKDEMDPEWRLEFSRFMEHCLSTGALVIRVDLTAVGRIDLNGVAALLRLQRRVHLRGRELWIQNARPSVERFLRRAGGHLTEP
jgi:ABC-type transporter Mla MlaB component